jgi:protein involved in polysaccharide export with SLBB domain
MTNEAISKTRWSGESLAPFGRRALRAAYAAAVLFAVSSCGGAPPDETAGGVAVPEYKMGSGDRLRITVYDQPNLSGEYRVDGGGNVAFPLIGAVPAQGKTARQLEEQIVGKLKPDFLANPSVGVEVLSNRPFYILGEVRNPGSYPYVEGMTVLNAIALAGGFTYRAREDSFYVIRSDDPQRARRTIGPAVSIAPGDVITVRERYF